MAAAAVVALGIVGAGGWLMLRRKPGRIASPEEAATAAEGALAGFVVAGAVVGADTWEGDPISHFNLTTVDYAVLARDIAGAGWPSVIVMEGGYAVDALGANVAGFLSGF